MKLSLKYGLTEVELSVPNRHFARFVSFAGQQKLGDRKGGHLEHALTELAESEFPSAVRDRVLGLLLADASRERSFESLLPGLAGMLRSARELRVFVCTGTHDPHSAENVELCDHLRRRLNGLSIPARVSIHDARAADLELVGTTTRGTRVEINPETLGCDCFLVLANMKNHYFAGYSNPVKYFLPGLGSFETARGNHSLTLEKNSTFGRHPWHPNPDRRNNPLAADMVNGFQMIVGQRPHFAVVVVGADKRPAWCGAGRTEAVAGRAMEVIDRIAGLEVRPSRFLVVSPGGHPHDESLYTAQRALELTRAAVQTGGEVLFLAACANGVGSAAARQNFFEPLRSPLEEVCRRPEGEYVMYSHKSYKFGLYLTGLGRVYMHSELPASEVSSIHLAPAADAQAVLDHWVSSAGPEDEVTFIDDASRFAFYRETGAAQVPMP